LFDADRHAGPADKISQKQAVMNEKQQKSSARSEEHLPGNVKTLGQALARVLVEISFAAQHL
jgi:hypothetical protein